VTIRRPQLDREADAILAVQRAGYAAEAALVGVESLPPQHQTLDDLRGEALWVAEDEGRVVGLLGLEEGAGDLTIARLVVDPRLARRGVGRALVLHALALAGGRPVRVGTAAANAPALALYESLGFARVAERTVGDGLAYVDLVIAST
jgi:ribosomal protein S18 acetylase RimI-like enzyme